MLNLGIPLSSKPINDDELELLRRELKRRISKDSGQTKDLALLVGRLIIRIKELQEQVDLQIRALRMKTHGLYLGPEQVTSPLYMLKATDPEAAAKLTDAERYRLLVAQGMYLGKVRNKAEFDLLASLNVTLAVADEMIKLGSVRAPGCKAWRYGARMVCDCGATWKADDPNPPACKEPANG